MNLGVLTAVLSSSNQTSQRPFQRIPSVDGLVACMVKRIDVSIQSLFYAVILIIFQKVGNKSLRVLLGDFFFLLGLKFSRIKKEYPIGFVYRLRCTGLCPALRRWRRLFCPWTPWWYRFTIIVSGWLHSSVLLLSSPKRPLGHTARLTGTHQARFCWWNPWSARILSSSRTHPATRRRRWRDCPAWPFLPGGVDGPPSSFPASLLRHRL